MTSLNNLDESIDEHSHSVSSLLQTLSLDRGQSLSILPTMSNFLNRCCVTWCERVRARSSPFVVRLFDQRCLSCSHDQTEASPAEEGSADTGSMSPKDKWFRAYAVQQLSLSPDLIDFTIRYHVVLSTRQRVNVFSREHGEPMADLVRQAVFPFEQTTAHVVWLASDHLHLYIDATPDYALDEIVHAIREHLEHEMTHLFPALQHSNQPCMGTSVFCRRHRMNRGCLEGFDATDGQDTPWSLEACVSQNVPYLLSPEERITMKIVILGAGALGTVLGAHLARAGEDVTLIARGQRAAYLQEHGATITGLVDFTVPVPVVTDPSQVHDADVLIVTVKTYDMDAALASVKHLDVGSVLSIQNGVLKNEQLAQTFGWEKVLGATAMFTCRSAADRDRPFHRQSGVLPGRVARRDLGTGPDPG